MKQITIAIALITFIAAAGFAAGSQEQTEQTWDPGQGMMQRDGDYTGELITVTGEIMFEENGFPELISGEDKYELMYHFPDTSELDINEGDEVTVSGYLMPGPGWDTDADENHIMLISAIIDGKEYILEHDLNYGPQGMMGRHNDRGRGSMIGGSSGRRSW